ncbi:MAG TPA: hypothetical protein VJA26_12545 [Gammaproteobacteria bacterium]|nr:hypothetical protein [Gammaproteobacteria bacterium]
MVLAAAAAAPATSNAGGEDFTYKIGYTGYYYTDDFDDTYNEVNLGIGYGIFALGYGLLNLRAGFRSQGPWEAVLCARNALDKDYLQFVSIQSGNSGRSSGRRASLAQWV